MTNDFVIKLENTLGTLFLSISLPNKNEHKNSSRLNLLLAVSGGADSVALLCAFVQLREKLGIKLSVLTVNHHLRPDAETNADADFVITLCKKLGVACAVAELSGEKISAYARIKKCGVEAAARHFRYRALKKRLAEVGADFIVTAHNQNDLYETVLMRLFQGANPESLNAIKVKRGHLLRPLLNCSRAEILAFLKNEQQDFRTDSTNAQTKYLRNRVRLELIPALDTTFPNWRKSLDKTLEKISWDCDAAAIPLERQRIKKINEWEVRIDAEFFQSAPKAVRRRLFTAAFSELCITRLSHEFIKNCLALERGGRCEIGTCGVYFAHELFVYKKTKNDLAGFSVLVERAGEYELPFGKIEAFSDSEAGENRLSLVLHAFDKNAHVEKTFKSFIPPFSVRSIFPGDKIRISPQGYKSVKKFLSESGLDTRKLLTVPVIEYRGEILGIWGEVAGVKNRRKFGLQR